MKNRLTKGLLVFSIFISIITMFISCGDVNSIVGVWEYKSEPFTHQKIIFDKDGSYQMYIYSIFGVDKNFQGTYAVEGNTITLNSVDTVSVHTFKDNIFYWTFDDGETWEFIKISDNEVSEKVSKESSPSDDNIQEKVKLNLDSEIIGEWKEVSVFNSGSNEYIWEFKDNGRAEYIVKIIKNLDNGDTEIEIRSNSGIYKTDNSNSGNSFSIEWDIVSIEERKIYRVLGKEHDMRVSHDLKDPVEWLGESRVNELYWYLIEDNIITIKPDVGDSEQFTKVEELVSD